MDQIARTTAADDLGILSLISRALEDAKQVARAEVDLQTVRLLTKVDEARNAALFLVAALVTGSLALTALVVGMLMILAPRLGPIWATVVVVGVLGVAAGICGWLCFRQVQLMFGGGAKQP